MGPLKKQGKYWDSILFVYKEQFAPAILTDTHAYAKTAQRLIISEETVEANRVKATELWL